LVRNVLKEGLVLQQQWQSNPFELGFIGSTDTHNATAGGAQEYDYVGHLGRRDADYRNVQDHLVSNPGGHAVVWAHENSRDAIFDAMRNRETYATSGTRPIVRFFGGAFPEDACSRPDRDALGYSGGVPMGGTLLPKNLTTAPEFLVYAQKDPGVASHPGTDLQRIQIIKGWVDADGNTAEQVIDVAGNPNNQATVDRNSCAPIGVGYSELCTVWTDPNYDPSESAFYYARVVENPSCRWSTLQCMAAGVNPFDEQCAAQATAASTARGISETAYSACCKDPSEEAFYSPIIQERAWTSPIWVPTL
jgi:hypothetical protein